MERDTFRQKKSKTGRTLGSGAIALTFLVLGFESALFMHKAAELRLEAIKAVPDTVYILRTPELENGTMFPTEDSRPGAREGKKSKPVPDDIIVKRTSRDGRELFRFDPNIISQEDLQRLGFSEKQAKSIVNYRSKGGHFSRKSDFKASFTVSDEMYERLESFIDIPLLDLNTADSAAFDALPGIGGFFAAKMVKEREILGGYSSKEQLKEIWNFTEDRYNGLQDLVTVSNPAIFPLWSAQEHAIASHPYIRNKSVAHGIVLFRENNKKDDLTLENLLAAGVIDEETFRKLSLLVIH